VHPDKNQGQLTMANAAFKELDKQRKFMKDKYC
jgi:hypothetical protein